MPICDDGAFWSFLVWQSEMVALFLRASYLCRSVMVELPGHF